MEIAEVICMRSTCERLHVGALIVSEDLKNIRSFGYNGNYAGGPNTCDSTEKGNCGCTHAEINCLIKSRSDRDIVMFVSQSPCINCAKAIINAGIRKVFYRYEYRDDSGLKLLKKAKVEVVRIK